MFTQHHLPLLPSLFIFSLLLAFTLADPNATSPSSYKEIEVVVEGMVYCQSCMKAGTWSLTGAKPLASAKVGISCNDHKNRVGFYKVFQSDNEGYFFAPLQGLDMRSYHSDRRPIESCTVHLLSSPDPKCNLLTNINTGINGSPLRYENKKLSRKIYKAVIYSAGPLAFRPAYCPLMPHN